MNRRALMKAIFGGAAAASAGIRPQDIVGAVPSGAATPIGLNSVGLVAPEIDPIQAAMREKSWKLQRHLSDKREWLNYTPAQLPPHIQSMKSWSPVYRHSQWMREIQELKNAINALDDPNLGAKIFDMLIGGEE